MTLNFTVTIYRMMREVHLREIL